MAFGGLKSSLMLGAAAVGAFVSAPALAQSADDAEGGDIIVTARRTEERLQDVPISITVFNSQQLAQRNIAVATDLAVYTPSLSVDQRYGPEKSSFSIRGFNQDQATAPTVGVYFAEVVGVRAQGGTTSGNSVGAGAFTDLQNVQVLKGPQGTLFGRNTTGGAVLLTPQKPTSEFEGYIEGSYGNYDSKKITGAINIPLADTFKVRAVVERNKRDGYLVNQVDAGPRDYNNLNYFYARLSVVADLTPDLENYTIAHYSNSSTHGYASRITGCATSDSPTLPLITDRTIQGYSATRHLQALSCQTQLARQTARGDSLYDIETRNPSGFLDIKQWQVINTTTWKASDTITIKNIASYGEFRERANFDLGSSNFTVPALETSPIFGPGFDLTRINPRLTLTGQVGGTPLFATAGASYGRIVLDTAGPDSYNSAQSTFTEELQIRAQTEKLDAVIGGYLEFSRPLGSSQGRTGIFLTCVRAENIDCTNPLFIGSISESSTKLNFDNHGIFAQATYKFTEQFSVTGGIRYTFDKITGYTDSTRAGFSPSAFTGAGFVDPLSGKTIYRACTDSVRRGDQKPGLDRSVCISPLENKSSKPTWLIGVDYKPSRDILVYAKYARGYRQGGINFTNPGLELWSPEQMDSYEIGLKSSFRGAVSGYFNLSGFYNNLTDMQVFGGLVASPLGASLGVAGGAGIINVGKARSYGLEMDASVLLFERLRFSAAYTHLKTKVIELPSQAELNARLVGTPFGQFLARVQKDGPFNNSPEHKFTVTANYTLPLDESMGKASVGVTWAHTSSYINDGTAPASVNGIGLGVTPSTNLVNLNFDWNSVAGSPVDLSLFVTNLTKETYNVASTGAWASAGVAEIILNQPRLYGVRLRYSFGR